jgi:hypothetical protein
LRLPGSLPNSTTCSIGAPSPRSRTAASKAALAGKLLALKRLGALDHDHWFETRHSDELPRDRGGRLDHHQCSHPGIGVSRRAVSGAQRCL